MPIGTGMASLACLLKDLGNEVIGSDSNNSYFTESKLKQKQIKYNSFGINILKYDYIYIISNAYDENNVEVGKIKKNNYKFFYYHDFIGKMLDKEIIAISGTHGKTTTTSFLVQLLNHQTSYIIGDGSGGGYLDNDLLVLEACEYKNHFLSYSPSILVINNIELDHPDFFKNIDEVINSFQLLVNKSNFVIANGDDLGVNKLQGKNILKVGQNNNNDIIFKIIKTDSTGYMVNLCYCNNCYAFKVPFLGEHLVYDFVMAYVVCIIMGKNPYMLNISLPSRRMTEYKYGNTIIIDDYAHHPTEIKALYDSVKSKYKDYKLNVIFQPHTYSRTLKLKNKFIESLNLFDQVYLEKVFTSVRENNSIYLQKKIDKIFSKFNKFNKSVLENINKENKDIWIFLGAGEVNKYIDEILES